MLTIHSIEQGARPLRDLAAEMKDTAHDLATRIRAGLLNELDETQRTDMAALSCAILRWHDEIGGAP